MDASQSEQMLQAEVDKIETFKQKFMSEFLKRVVRRTPVDTGKLQGSWVGRVDGNIYVENSAEYAEFVENGTPKNAPVGMIRTTVAEAQSIADNICQELK